MEQARREKGRAQAADAVRAEQESVTDRRQVPARGRAEVAVGAAMVRAVGRDAAAWVPALVAAAVAVVNQRTATNK
jgi:hypothetical protein